MFFQFFQKRAMWCAMLLALVMFLGASADAQTPDLDLVTERSLGLSVSATGGAEYRSGLLVAPWQVINGGALCMAHSLLWTVRLSRIRYNGACKAVRNGGR